MLAMINEGNKSSGGLTKIATACGIVGFVKFVDCYYLTLVTQKRLVGSIGGNSIYGIKSTEIFAIRPREASDSNVFLKMWRKLNEKLSQTGTEIAESRYMTLFQLIDLSKDFFFSYNYDLTHSLQHNYLLRNGTLAKTPTVEAREKLTQLLEKGQEKFTWNHYQLEGVSASADCVCL